ncbi:MAG: hydrogenase maturation protease [Chitinivibrionales bacterium]|nr:hydrogenase maturation protease [Chitinivibrionales bacterium]
MAKILVYGYGNPGRSDDGLGVLLAERIEKESLPGITVETNYQLNAEDALEISQYDAVIFADASENDIEPFRFTKLQPEYEVSFSTHAMSPGSVLKLCHELYRSDLPAFLLEMKGYDWAMAEGLSEKAEENLQKAFAFALKRLKEGSLESLITAAG